jgi:hypothetical protein
MHVNMGPFSQIRLAADAHRAFRALIRGQERGQLSHPFTRKQTHIDFRSQHHTRSMKMSLLTDKIPAELRMQIYKHVLACELPVVRAWVPQ